MRIISSAERRCSALGRHAIAERDEWAAICCCTFQRTARAPCRITTRSTRRIATRWRSRPTHSWKGVRRRRAPRQQHAPMAIDEVARDFEVTARCPDGIVEAIESRNPDWFAMGTQFHPRQIRPRRSTCGCSKNSWRPSDIGKRCVSCLIRLAVAEFARIRHRCRILANSATLKTSRLEKVDVEV